MKGHQAIVDGYTITIKTLTKPDIADEDSLLREVLEITTPGEKLPLKINWDNKALVKLIDTGIISLDDVRIKEEKHLALSKNIITEE